MLAEVLTRLDALESGQAAAPSVAVDVPKPNGFIAFLAQQNAAKIAAGTHKACAQPGCTGIGRNERTTTINGLFACKRHYGGRR
jgi:hypothetical protein